VVACPFLRMYATKLSISCKELHGHFTEDLAFRVCLRNCKQEFMTKKTYTSLTTLKKKTIQWVQAKYYQIWKEVLPLPVISAL